MSRHPRGGTAGRRRSLPVQRDGLRRPAVPGLRRGRRSPTPSGAARAVPRADPDDGARVRPDRRATRPGGRRRLETHRVPGRVDRGQGPRRVRDGRHRARPGGGDRNLAAAVRGDGSHRRAGAARPGLGGRAENPARGVGIDAGLHHPARPGAAVLLPATLPVSGERRLGRNDRGLAARRATPGKAPGHGAAGARLADRGRDGVAAVVRRRPSERADPGGRHRAERVRRGRRGLHREHAAARSRRAAARRLRRRVPASHRTRPAGPLDRRGRHSGPFGDRAGRWPGHRGATGRFGDRGRVAGSPGPVLPFGPLSRKARVAPGSLAAHRDRALARFVDGPRSGGARPVGDGLDRRAAGDGDGAGGVCRRSTPGSPPHAPAACGSSRRARPARAPRSARRSPRGGSP